MKPKNRKPIKTKNDKDSKGTVRWVYDYGSDGYEEGAEGGLALFPKIIQVQTKKKELEYKGKAFVLKWLSYYCMIGRLVKK